MCAVTRLAPDRPFPPYSFVPGQTPHPRSDKAGHSYGVATQHPAALAPERWRESQEYLFGLDLFNAQFYWEAHEHLEGLWLAAGRRGPVADFLKGLIKLAAAGVKHREGTPAGVRSHACRAAKLLRAIAPAAQDDMFAGLALSQLVKLAESVCNTGWPGSPPIILP